MECFCFQHCVLDVVKEGKTPFELRYGVKYEGPLIPFGAEVHYKPSSDADVAKLHASLLSESSLGFTRPNLVRGQELGECLESSVVLDSKNNQNGQ